RQFADKLEKSKDFNKALHDLIRKTIKAHKRIIFNGNGYDDAWIKEAEKRGLLNLKTTADAMPHICDKKNVEMLTSHGIFTEAEIFSRRDIMLENYVKTVNIEAMTMIDMARKEIIPAVAKFAADTASAVSVKKSVSKAACKYETKLVTELTELVDAMDEATSELEADVAEFREITEILSASEFIRDTMLPAMDKLRSAADKAETMTAEEYYPFPAYDKLLFGV
ncbi:MAG TPA: glutamine synthetase type III, partial [Ruminococcus sp.]|nr:glutamine synthetase type III [Ruminococcus sp.]